MPTKSWAKLAALLILALAQSRLTFAGDGEYPLYFPNGLSSYGVFQFSELLYIQNSGGSTFGPELTWAPTWEIEEAWAIEGNLGAGLVRANDGATNTAFRLQGFLTSAEMAPVTAGIGAGIQYWTGRASGLNPVFTLQAGYKLSGQRLDRILISYTACPAPSSDFTHEIRLGVGFAL